MSFGGADLNVFVAAKCNPQQCIVQCKNNYMGWMQSYANGYKTTGYRWHYVSMGKETAPELLAETWSLQPGRALSVVQIPGVMRSLQVANRFHFDVCLLHFQTGAEEAGERPSPLHWHAGRCGSQNAQLGPLCILDAQHFHHIH